jgi:hypothetical protein
MTKQKVKVSTYAGMIGKSKEWVYKLIRDKKVKSERVDGVHFVVIEP